jgi:hypothetical protein
MPEITIAGKRVVIREDYPARENWDLPNLLGAMAGDGTPGSMNMEKAPALLARVIESWEFDADPSDVEAYGDMNLWRELLPLTNHVATFLNEEMGLGEET